LTLAQQSDQPRPTCLHCQAAYVPLSELDAYTAKAVKYGIVDQQVRSVDVGKSQVGVAMVTRGKLVAGIARKGAVAEHEQISEVYHIIEGTATLMTGPDIADMVRRPATQETVRLFNGPGNNGSTIRNGVSHQLKPGDVMVIPAGTGHWFQKIDDHIVYLMVRIDPDKVTPLKDEAASRLWLKTPHAASGN